MRRLGFRSRSRLAGMRPVAMGGTGAGRFTLFSRNGERNDGRHAAGNAPHVAGLIIGRHCRFTSLYPRAAAICAGIAAGSAGGRRPGA